MTASSFAKCVNSTDAGSKPAFQEANERTAFDSAKVDGSMAVDAAGRAPEPANPTRLESVRAATHPTSRSKVFELTL